MKPDYQQIVDDYCAEHGNSQSLRVTVENVATRCEALDNKPVRELTHAEKYVIWSDVHCGRFDEADWMDCLSGTDVVDKILKLAACKQSEPEEIPFDQAKLDGGGWDAKVYANNGNFVVNLDGATKVTLVRKQ